MTPERERVILKNSEQAFRYSKSVLTTTTIWAVVVAQLVERSLPTPEIRGSNPVIGKLLYRTFNCLSTVNCIEKTKIKKKEAGNFQSFLDFVLFKKPEHGAA